MAALTLDGEAGALEALIDLPAGAPTAAALLCHPHPPSGGTMHTHAVFRAMRALRGLGCAVLRFNFRGVGKSAGNIGDGAGELADGRVALEALQRLQPGLPVIAGGFSFGAWVGMRVGADRGAQALLGLGAPYARYDFSRVALAASPKAFVLADGDQFTTEGELRAAISGMRPPAQLWMVAHASHLFTEALDPYEAQVVAAGRWLLEQL
jgi:alpha/beta superfamily hydrolase